MSKILLVETKLHLRDGWSLLFTLGLPLLLLVFLGRVAGPGFPALMVMLSVLTVSFSVLPGVLAAYREQGVLRRMSTTPVSPLRMLTVQLLINLVVATVATVLLIAFGPGVPKNVAGFVLVFLLGSAALMAMGLVIAALAPNGKSAPIIGSAVMFPLMFVAGMWVPREFLPEIVRVIGDYSVAGPFAQALGATWAGQSPQLTHLLVLTAGVVIFGGIAVRVFRWE
ncbi:ABC transporter permease [Nonomuraea africana]|uniref:ABC-2 type transport system permease protein n=1 Tax=Nonomuraea africana TaxID=46171 RepID=A0ABR9KQN3_9ACTN|nr:ABC transporter permease [Nonomuraea africana]MBE1564340.1 ABC-2 type transport system permease protein [Nonomuraea africana]